MKQRVSEFIERIPSGWLENYVSAFEAGRVQKHPHARFVTENGESCLVGALAGARTSAEVVASPIWSRFLGTELEDLSRHFETRRLTAQEFYEEVLLALATRKPAARPAVAALATSSA